MNFGSGWTVTRSAWASPKPSTDSSTTALGSLMSFFMAALLDGVLAALVEPYYRHPARGRLRGRAGLWRGTPATRPGPVPPAGASAGRGPRPRPARRRVRRLLRRRLPFRLRSREHRTAAAEGRPRTSGT